MYRGKSWLKVVTVNGFVLENLFKHVLKNFENNWYNYPRNLQFSGEIYQLLSTFEGINSHILLFMLQVRPKERAEFGERVAWKAYGILGSIVAESLLSMAKMFPIFLLFGNTVDFGEANFVSATMLLEVVKQEKNIIETCFRNNISSFNNHLTFINSYESWLI